MKCAVNRNILTAHFVMCHAHKLCTLFVSDCTFAMHTFLSLCTLYDKNRIGTFVLVV